MNEKVIYSKWLAYELRKLGFKIIRTDINPNYPQYDIYVFEDSPAFQRAFIALSANRKHSK